MKAYRVTLRRVVLNVGSRATIQVRVLAADAEMAKRTAEA